MRIIGILMALVLTLGFAQSNDSMMSSSRFAVTITNNSNQIFSPPLLINHTSDYALFTQGEAASAELARLAEDGDASELAAIASLFPEVNAAIVAEGPVMPGESVTIEIEVDNDFHYLSVAGMLVTSNDAFFAQLSTPLFDMMSDDMMDSDMSDSDMSDSDMSDDAMADDMNDSDMSDDDMMSDDMMMSPHANVYDAGTEANTELCADIPGPPCGNGGVRVTDGAEGTVEHHAGLMGNGDIDAAALNWEGPVATISIEQLP